MKLFLFLSVLAAVAAAGGFLLHYASRHPIRLATTAHPPAADPGKASPMPTVPEPAEPAPVKTEPTRGIQRQPAVSAENNRPEPESASTRTERLPVEERTAEKAFQALMSAGMNALDRSDYPVAQDAFTKAKRLKPESPEVKDALARVDAAVRLKFIADLEKSATAAEQAEDWPGALDNYTEALKIDGNLRFALEGKARASARGLMDKRLQYYLQKPGALASDSGIQTAAGLVESAEAVSPKGPRLRSQIDRLRKAIQIAQTPVRVILESDTLTEVAIYQVGRFGTFREKVLELRPGAYTIVGTRDGYKDVRQTLEITADDRTRHVTVRCEEAI